MGLAGGVGFDGNSGVLHESTAALLRKLIAKLQQVLIGKRRLNARDQIIALSEYGDTHDAQIKTCPPR